LKLNCAKVAMKESQSSGEIQSHLLLNSSLRLSIN